MFWDVESLDTSMNIESAILDNGLASESQAFDIRDVATYTGGTTSGKSKLLHLKVATQMVCGLQRPRSIEILL